MGLECVRKNFGAFRFVFRDVFPESIGEEMAFGEKTKLPMNPVRVKYKEINTELLMHTYYCRA